jgi:hypothetical protein
MSSWAQATPAAAESSSANVPANKTPAKEGRIESLITASISEDVIEERCVVDNYRTTAEQRDKLIDLLRTCPRDRVPLEWVIDIADETNGWFYGTAYHYDDTTNMLHVMVPDKENPTFDGPVYLDHRTVHLVECVDGNTEALFNKIIRENIIRVKWEVDWFEEDATPTATPIKVLNGGHRAHLLHPPPPMTPPLPCRPSLVCALATQGPGPSQQNGRWIASAARYYLRIANQLLVEVRIRSALPVPPFVHGHQGRCGRSPRSPHPPPGLSFSGFTCAG